MDVNEEFAAKLACVRCGRAVRNKSKWFRLTEQDNGLNFYYRCASVIRYSRSCNKADARKAGGACAAGHGYLHRR